MPTLPHAAGGASARDIARAATALLHDRHITRITSQATLDALLAAHAQRLPSALLFTAKAAPTSLSKGLSCALAGRLAFAEVGGMHPSLPCAEPG
jgi:hypothetical protein